MGHVTVVGGCRTTKPSADILLGNIAEGQVVKINENGTPTEFYVAKHNYESTLNGNGRTLILRKDCYDVRPWDQTNKDAYATSTIDAWLNDGYKNLFDASVKNAIGTTKFYYTPGDGNKNVSTLTRSVFILSITELGKSGSYANSEGTAIPIATNCQVAYLNGVAVIQCTRSPDNAGMYLICSLDTGGNFMTRNCMSFYGSRPAFTLPSNTIFDRKTMLFRGVA